MKKFTQLLALVACMLTFVSQTAFAATDPGSLNFYYAVGSGDWTYSNPMTKSGSKYTFTVQGANNEDIHFLIHKNSGSNWNSVVINNNVYSTGNNKNGEITVSSSPTTLYLYGECDHCLKLSSVTGNVTFSVDFSGSDVQLTYTVGSVVNPDPDPTPGDYTVYFYCKPNEVASAANLKAYVWNGNDKLTEWEARESLERVTKDGKEQFIYINNENCPVWKYTFSWTEEPANIIFSYGNNSTSQTGNLKFTNNGFYTFTTPTGQDAQTGLLIGDEKKDVVTIYMHFKEDYLQEGNQSYKPKCHVYGGGKEYTTGQWQVFGESAEDMYLVNEKYQIWAFDLDKKKMADSYDNIIFYFYTKSEGVNDPNTWREYRTDNVSYHDKANWSKYIYSTVIGGQAVQAYLSYDKFMELDAQGRPKAYVVGPAALKVNGQNFIHDNTNGTEWNPLTPVVATPEDGVFYLEMVPDFAKVDNESVDDNNRKYTGFKVGWIDVAAAKAWAKPSNNVDNSQRGWVTYDLGIIGVNDLDTRLDGKIDIQVDGQLAKFHTNTSVSYINYNQYNWTLVEGTAQSGKTYYAVIDTHSECRSVTLCTVNPQPNMTVSASGFDKETVAMDVAKAMHNEHLKAADVNGHIFMQNVNFAKGSIQIQAAGEDEWKNAGFTRTYTLWVNDNEVAETDADSRALYIDYMPFTDSDDALKLRAKYTDRDTKLTFHSRVRTGKFANADTELAAPEVPEFKAQLVMEYWDDAAQEAVFGIYVENFDIMVGNDARATGLHKYTDFDIEGDKEVELLHADSPIYKEFPGILSYWGANDNDWDWTPAANEDEYNADKHDWSTRLHAVRENTPLFIHDVYRSETFPKDAVTVNGNLYAVYPFIYNPDAQVKFDEGQSQKPESYDGFLVANSRKATPFTLVAEPDNVVSGVEGIEADTDVDAPVEYYTISGIRVMGDPAPGLYIRRQGDKVSKVVIR